jgi:uncharacterized protein with von Willebrand factor type A (vWA) domain
MTTTRTYQELSVDALKKKDFILLVDISGSMAKASDRFSGKNRLKEVAEDVGNVARLAEQYDDDGITLITFNSDISVKDNVKADAVENIFDEITPNYGTATNLALDAAFAKAKSSSKEAVIVCWTDGEPNEYQSVVDSINKAAKSMGRPKVGLVFIQVGHDQSATKFLNQLDEHLEGDITAVIEAKEAASLTAGKIAWAALNL